MDGQVKERRHQEWGINLRKLEVSKKCDKQSSVHIR